MLKRKHLFILRHFDFILIDLIAFIAGFFLSLRFRSALHIDLKAQHLFFVYGLTATISFLLVEIVTERLNGVVSRGLIQEIQSVIVQMTMTFSVYLSLLFLMHIIFSISRLFTVFSYFFCMAFVLAFRTFWKLGCKYFKTSMLPKLLIITDADKAQTVLERLLPGSLRNEYEICGLVTNGSKVNYHDWYPLETGLENTEKMIADRRVQEAYVELTDAEAEKQTVDLLLAAGIVVHRSLGDSNLQYARQGIAWIGGKSVITITGNTEALTARADKLWQKLRGKVSKGKEDGE